MAGGVDPEHPCGRAIGLEQRQGGEAPKRPPPGGERVDSAAASRTSTDDVISPRTGGITDELEGSHSATLDTSQLHVKDDFFGGGDPVPETLRMTMTSSMTSSSIEFGKTGQFAMEES